MRVRTKTHDLAVADARGEYHKGLSPDTEYYVIGIINEYFRTVDDHGEPVLYPQDSFAIVDDTVPEHWERVDYDDDESYWQSPLMAEPGLFERVFDSNGDVAIQQRAQAKLLGALRKEFEAAGQREDKALLQRAINGFVARFRLADADRG